MMKKNKKIAIYSGEIPSSTFIEKLIFGLAKNNEIFVFGFKSKKIKYSSKNIKIVGYSNKINKLISFLKYSFLLTLIDFKNKQKLDKIIQKKSGNNLFLKTKYYPVLYHKPDVFHLQWAKGVADWSWVQDFGIKLLLSLRGTHITISPYADENLKQDFIKYFPKIDGFHAVSNAIKKEVLQYGIEADKITVVYSGVETEKVASLPNHSQPTTHNPQPVTILSVGRNHWVKGYNVALDACKILDDKRFDFNYQIIGIDNKSEELIFQKSQLHLDGKVEFINQLPHKKVLESIKKANILLLPSIEEGIANVVLEAMATGTIVLSTNCGGMSEVIIDGENGFLVPIRNPLMMAEKLIEISKLSDEKLKQIRENAYQTILKNHNFDNMIGAMEGLYKNI